jgi:hypothetical protein
MLVLRIVLALAFLGLAGFCLFGFLTTYEPSATSFLAWRLAYAAGGAAALAAAGITIARR